MGWELRYRVKLLRLWFWQRVGHRCVQDTSLTIAGWRTLCRRCGAVMWKDPR